MHVARSRTNHVVGRAMRHKKNGLRKVVISVSKQEQFCLTIRSPLFFFFCHGLLSLSPLVEGHWQATLRVTARHTYSLAFRFHFSLSLSLSRSTRKYAETLYLSTLTFVTTVSWRELPLRSSSPSFFCIENC